MSDIDSRSAGDALLSRRIPESDALRGIGVLLVMFGHIFGAPLFWATTLMDLFFFFSGYFITRILLAIGTTPRGYLAFYVRRALRIWPLYYLVLSGCLLVNWLLLRAGWGPRFNIQPITILQDYTFTQFIEIYWGQLWYGLPFMDHAWSLAVDEQFYLLWPLVVWLILRRFYTGLALLALLIAVSTAIHFAIINDYILASRFDSFALGTLLTVVASDLPAAKAWRRKIRWTRVFLWMMALSGAVAATYVVRGYQAIAAGRLPTVIGFEPVAVTAFKLLYAGLGSYVFFRSGERETAVLRFKPLVYLGGRLSYPIYLIHYPLIGYGGTFLARRWGLPDTFAALLMGLLAVALAWVWYEKVDRKMEALKRFFPYVPATRAASLPGSSGSSRS